MMETVKLSIQTFNQLPAGQRKNLGREGCLALFMGRWVKVEFIRHVPLQELGATCLAIPGRLP